MKYTQMQNVKLFAGIRPEDMDGMLDCIGHYVRDYEKVR